MLYTGLGPIAAQKSGFKLLTAALSFFLLTRREGRTGGWFREDPIFIKGSREGQFLLV
jgi:hypothetical protein